MPPTLPPRFVDALVVGGGPAGLAAALAFARTRTTAILFDSQSYRNEGIPHMHTVPSRDHVDPYEFRRIAREQISSRYDTVWIKNVEIKSVVQKEIHGQETNGKSYVGFEVGDASGEIWRGRKVVMATGSRDVFPKIPGYKDNWPVNIYQCPACDGFERRNLPIGILDFSSSITVHFVTMALNFDSRVTIFSNGPLSSSPAIQSALQTALALGAKLDTRKITRLVDNSRDDTPGITVEFGEGENVKLGFLLHKPPTVNRAPELIEQLGLEMVGEESGGHVKVVDPMFNETSVRGCFAAGDTMALMKQVTIAMAEGVKAGSGVLKQIGEEKIDEAMRRAEAERAG